MAIPSDLDLLLAQGVAPGSGLPPAGTSPFLPGMQPRPRVRPPFRPQPQQMPQQGPQQAAGALGGAPVMPGYGTSLPAGMPSAYPYAGTKEAQQPNLNNLSLAAIMGLQGMKTEREEIERQRKLAEALRQSGEEQLAGNKAGGIYMAPGLANLGASLFSAYVAKGKDDKATADAKTLSEKEGAANRQFLNTLLNGGKRPTTPPNPFYTGEEE